MRKRLAEPGHHVAFGQELTCFIQDDTGVTAQVGDGWVWYPQCYASAWHCLFIDHSAYLQTDTRLVALLRPAGPLALAPKSFAFAALLIQAAPAVFLLSPRMVAAISSVAVRAALALLLVAIPGMSEVYVNLTNSQWHLALPVPNPYCKRRHHLAAAHLRYRTETASLDTKIS